MSSAGKLKARIVRVRVIENTRNKVELSLKDNSGTIDASVEFTKQVRIRIDHAMNLVLFL
jgi:D-Tyr-tRNAtyr deacylase